MSKNILEIDSFMAIRDPETVGITWYSPLNKNMFSAYGSHAFYEGNYHRLTEKEIEYITPVSDAVGYLATHPAGLQLKFETNSKNILVDVILKDKSNMPHMPATGQCGFDLYVYSEELDEYVHHKTTTYNIADDRYRYNLSDFHYFDEVKMRKYILNFPLYQGIKELKIGLDNDNTTKPLEFGSEGKIVLYGTSILQGGCVSRPGLLYTNILSRWFDMEFLNQGYSGSAMLEEEIASIISNIPNQKLFIIDAEANAGCDSQMIMENRLEKFIDTYLLNQPTTPILLVSRMLFSFDSYDPYRVKLHKYYKEFFLNLISKYQAKGVKISFLDGDTFFSSHKLNFTEFTVDGVHPTDFGSYLIAKAHYDAINKILKK